MLKDWIHVGIEVEKRAAKSQWIDHVWRVTALRLPALDLDPWTVLSDEPGRTVYYGGSAELAIYSADTKVYKDNIEAAAPSVYAVLRRAPGATGLRLYCVTVDPTEAHAHADVGEDIVEALPMPKTIHLWLSAFVARHHVERQEWKRKRDGKSPASVRPGKGVIQ